MRSATAFANGTFDPKVFRKSEYGRNALDMQKIAVEHKGDPMNPEVLKYWEEKGAKKELYEAGTDTEWSVFTPLDMDRTKKYPLIYCSHGGGDDIFIAETYGYNELVKPMQVICVYPQNGDRGNGRIETEFPRILDELEAKGYPIDRSRVYAVGFSAGSVASLRLAMSHPDKVAGICPVPGPNSFRGGILSKNLPTYKEKFGLRVPLICMGGTADGGDAWPLDEEVYFNNFNLWMKNVAGIESFKPMTLKKSQELRANSEDSVKRFFGLDFDKTWIEYFEGTFWYCGEFLDDDGKSIAQFVAVEGMPHMHCKNEAKEIYGYLKQFSRNLETGELVFQNENINHAKNS